jgi:hypothetical protein
MATLNDIRRSLARRKRRLLNSMAHTPRPRERDLERWREMQASIDATEAELAAILGEKHGES